MPIELTPSQNKALDDTRHLAIIANAGSGKTRVLVHRYIKILEDHPKLSPRNIIAITFTDEAAAELRARITTEVEARLKSEQESGSSERAERLTEIRNGLTGAYISTIHSFASRLLRAYPVEANVDATFGTLADSDKDLVVEETMQRVFESELKRAYKAYGDPLLRVFRQIGRAEMASVINTLLNSRTQARTLRKFIEDNDDATIIKNWKEELRLVFQSLINEQIPRLQKIHGLCPRRGVTYDKFHKALSGYEPGRGTFATLPLFRSALKIAITKNGCGALSKNLVPEKVRTRELTQLGEDIARTQIPLSNLLDEFTTEAEFDSSHVAYLAMLRPILRLYALVEQAYVEIKTRYSMLDFDDQIEKLHNLVHRPELADELSAAFPYILIDEYQDTDLTQFEIARALTLNFSTETKLSIVGDPKQSIYAFRNADLTTFFDAVACIRRQQLSTEAFENSNELTQDQTQGIITLAETFRMADEPLAFVNYAFRHIFHDSQNTDNASDSSYAELVAARTPTATGSVGWLINWSPKVSKSNHSEEEVPEELDGETASQYLDPEFALIASKIRDIVETNPTLYPIGEADTIPPSLPMYRDVSILLRYRKSLPDLERALVHYNIPYSVSRGVGFFEQQEVIDLVGYLNFLVRPNDDIALFGILRSPIFALSDTFFFRLHLSFSGKRSSTATTLWHRIQEACSREELTSEPLVRAVRQLRENLALAGRLAASSILEKILKESAIAGTFRAMPNGAQRVANIHKLINLVRGFDSRGFSTLFDTVSRLTDKISRNDRESQASVSDENSVKILTVHSAKGLEFPIVFVPRLGDRKNAGASTQLDARFGIRIRSKEAERPLITTLLVSERERAEREEEKRVLYVALTRAKDHLFLSAKLTGEAAPSNSALALFDPLIVATLFNQEAPSFSRQERFLRYNKSGESKVAEITLNIPILRSPIEIPAVTSKQSATDQSPLPEFHLERYTSARGLGRFSPSQLLTLEECPTKYYLRYILGLPEDARLASDVNVSELTDTVSESIRGTLVGQLIHSLFEHLDRVTNGAGLDINAFERHFRQLASSLGIPPEETGDYEARAKEDLERFIAHELHTIVREATVSHTEYMVQTSLNENDLLRGIIDRLFVAADGEIHILDYKTDQTTGAESPAKQARYEFQMRFYAYLVSLLFPERDTIRATLYYTRYGTTESYTFDRSSFAGIESTLTDMIGRARALESITKLTSLEQNLAHCRECGYFDMLASQCSVTAAAEAA